MRHPGTLYVPSLNGEQNWFNILRSRVAASKRGQIPTGLRRPLIETASSTCSIDGANSLDYAFIDPPFGANLFYSELSFIVESWLRTTTNNSVEAIENKAQSKDRFAAQDYATILALSVHLPANVIEEDEQLQMIHDMAEMRSEG